MHDATTPVRPRALRGFRRSVLCVAFFALFVGLIAACAPESPPPRQAPESAGPVNQEDDPPAVGETGGNNEPGRPADDIGHGDLIGDLESKLLDLAECGLMAGSIEPGCRAWTAYSATRRRAARALSDRAHEMGKMAERHLNHASPAVRMQAAGLVNSGLATERSVQDVLIAAAKSETEPLVLSTLLRTLGPGIAARQEIAELYKQHEDHADSRVRQVLIHTYSSTWARGLPESLDVIMKFAEEDPDPQIRELACRRLGARGDARALSLLERLTANPALDERLASACFASIISLWSSQSPAESPSEAAYRLTMKRLRARPRSESRPPWAAIANLNWTRAPEFRERAPWFDEQHLQDTLLDLSMDKQAGWMTRNAAIDVLMNLEIPQEKLDQLIKRYRKASGGPDGWVASKLDRSLASREKRRAAISAEKASTPAPTSAPPPEQAGATNEP